MLHHHPFTSLPEIPANLYRHTVEVSKGVGLNTLSSVIMALLRWNQRFPQPSLLNAVLSSTLIWPTTHLPCLWPHLRSLPDLNPSLQDWSMNLACQWQTPVCFWCYPPFQPDLNQF